jgi:hypothetical protein
MPPSPMPFMPPSPMPFYDDDFAIKVPQEFYDLVSWLQVQ